MEKISNHISWEEATVSETATKKNIPNTPNGTQLANMKLVATKLFEPIRVQWAKPILINSFFRSVALNKAIGGVATSQHCLGQAIDIDTGSRAENLKLFKLIKDGGFDFDQIIHEFGAASGPDWIHISYVSPEQNRGRALKAVKRAGKTVYENY